MTFDELRKRMEDKYGSITKFCFENGFNVATISRKLSGDRNFTRDEICYIGRVLELTYDDLMLCFFNDYRVDKMVIAI